MQFTISLVTGLVAGAIVLVSVGSAKTAASARPGMLGWAAYATGILAFGAGMLMMFGSGVFASVQASVGLAAASMVLSIGAYVKRDRHWPTWVGFGAGAVPAVFWIVFVAAEFVSPH